MIDKLLHDVEVKMRASLDYLRDELKKIRTGRANSSIVEDIKVSYYGAMMNLREVASITVPEPSLIQIKPFDKNSIGDIETAIRNSDIGINPINDGNFVRLNLPPLTEERRMELAKQIKKIGEEIKITTRNLRGEVWSKTQDAEKKAEITEDDKFTMEKKLNEVMEKINKEIDQIISEKEAEIMKI